MHLRRDKGLSVSAVKGYRSALNQVFALRGKDLSACRVLNMLIRSFVVSCPPVEVRPPAWDLSVVLRSLRKAPYEPMSSASERFVGQKALFLLALASSKRVGELHGLSFRVSHTEGWKEVSLSFVPGFVAKTQDPSVHDPRFESFTIPALPRGSDPEARLLCPVRALRRYLERTAEHRPALARLFLSTGESKKEVSKSSISYWIRQVISRAYALAGEPAPPHPRARETRGLGPSLLVKRNYDVAAVLKAGTWKRHSTFSRFYLRDLASRSLDVYHLGPVVAAQEVL